MSVWNRIGDVASTAAKNAFKFGGEVAGLVTAPVNFAWDIGTAPWNDDEEYTVSAFFDKSSQLIDYLQLKRRLSSDGYTQEAQVVDLDFENIISDLAKTFKPVGPTNFQFRIDGNDLKLLEINPRISSATSIR